MRVLVTGANRGIGLALAARFLSNGCRVIAGARDLAGAADLAALAAGSGGALRAVALDIDSEASLAAAAAEAEAFAGGLEVLVNNAGVFPERGDESILDIDLAHFRTAFETNVLGTVRATRAFLPLLEKGENPRVVNISTAAASISRKTNASYLAYSTSKAALNMVTRAMASELRPQGICVVALTPGWVRTRMGGSRAPLSPEESAASIAKAAEGLRIEQTSKFLERDGRECRSGW